MSLLVQTRTVPGTLTDSLSSIALDGAGASLLAASVNVTGNLVTTAWFQNEDASAGTLTVQVQGSVTLRPPGNAGPITAAPTTAQSLTQAGGGTSGITSGSVTATAQTSQSGGAGGSTLAWLAATGTISPQVALTAQLTATAPGNFRAVFGADESATVTTTALTASGSTAGSGDSGANSSVSLSTQWVDLGNDVYLLGSAQETQHLSIADLTTGTAGTTTLAGFDPALGTLQSVILTLDVHGTAFVAAENFSASSATISVNQAATLNLVSNGTTLLGATATDATARTLAAYDGTWDWQGSGFTATPASKDGVNSTTLTGSALAQFLTTGTVALSVQTSGQSSLSGPANMAVSAALAAGATLDVTYVYTPSNPAAAGTTTALPDSGTAATATTPAWALATIPGFTPGAAIPTAPAQGALLTGNDGPTTINGGTGHDTIVAGSGATTVASGTGGSLIALNSGAAYVHGGGPDTVVAGSGAATIGLQHGGLVFGGSGPTLFIGGDAPATVTGASGSQTIFGGMGGGQFAGGSAGNNVLVAGSGAATLWGGGDGDVLFAAGASGDVLVAGMGNETLNLLASSGNDTVFAGPGRDLVALGSGQDLVSLGTGNPTVIAGTGADTFTLTRGAARDITLYGIKPGTDAVALFGYTPADHTAPAIQTTAAGTTVTLSDNTTIHFMGLSSLPGTVLF